MKVYTVQRMDKYDYDFSVERKNGGCYIDRNKALEQAKKMYESLCGEYEDEMLRYSDEDEYPEVGDGALEIIEGSESGYYRISFGFEEYHEVHSITVDEWEVQE